MADYSFYTYSPDVLVFDPNTLTFQLDGGYDFATDRNFIEYSDDDATFDGRDNNNGGVDDANQIGAAFDSDGNEIESGQIYASAFA